MTARPTRTTKLGQKLVVLGSEENLALGIAAGPTLPASLSSAAPASRQRSAPIPGLGGSNGKMGGHQRRRSELPGVMAAPTEHRHRVVAYCTCQEFRMLEQHLQQSVNLHYPAQAYTLTLARYEECVYVRILTKSMDHSLVDISTTTTTDSEHGRATLTQESRLFLGAEPPWEVFVMDYGVVVFWGWPSEREERQFIQMLCDPIAEQPLPMQDQEREELTCMYDPRRTPKIYNNVIVLNPTVTELVMVKLTISMAVAQSAKLGWFERLVDASIDATEHIPHVLAKEGTMQMSRKETIRLMGELFRVRSEVNLNSSVTDIPDLFRSETWLKPLYEVVGTYFEIEQRVRLLNQRVLVISDMLDMLNDHTTKAYGERLDWIVVLLVFVATLIAGLEIVLKFKTHGMEVGEQEHHFGNRNSSSSTVEW